MRDEMTNKRRRRLLAGSVAIAAMQKFSFARAQGVSAQSSVLNVSALRVRAPDRVVLISITITPAKRIVAVGEHGVVIYSNDNGTTWLQAQVPVDVTLTCVAFATAAIGWAAGHFGTVLKTEDGGLSWVKQLDGNLANQLMLQAANNPNVQKSVSPAAALAIPRAQHFLDVGAVLPFLTMIVFSDSKVLLLGAYRLAMLTTDGGHTWQDWSLNIYYRTSINLYAAAQIGAAYYLAAEQGVVFNSKDGGTTFQSSVTPAGTTLFGVLGGKDGSVNVFGVAGTVFRSTDNGASWNASQIDTQDGLTGGRVLHNGDILLASESGQIYRSLDNGQIFSPVLANPTLPLFDIQELGNGELLGVGPTGVTIFRNSL